MKQKKPTSIDVAAAAGVSQSTVSLILNGKRRHSFTEETISRVLESAEKLGYQAARTAPLPHTAQSREIAIICPVLSNPYYTTVLQTIEQAAFQNGCQTCIYTTYRSHEIELQHLDALEQRNPAGVIFTTIPLHIERVEQISKRIPVVVIGDRDDRINVDTVEVDSFRSGIIIAEHLLELGHRRMAFLSTSLNSQNTIRVKRMEGVQHALAQSGLGCELTVKSRDVSGVADNGNPWIEQEVGRALALECLESEKATALIGVNDMVAYGALDAVRDSGCQVPADYSICGFDNIFPSAINGVQLTSMENHMVQKGENALRMLLKKVRRQTEPKEPDHDSITRVEYQPKLIVRSSTGAARTQ